MAADEDTLRKIQREINQSLRELRRQVGRNIHELRLCRRLTLTKLSRRCGLNSETLDRLEMGKGSGARPPAAPGGGAGDDAGCFFARGGAGFGGDA